MWRSPVRRFLSPPLHADGVFHSTDPAGGSGGEGPASRVTKTELRRELAEHRQTEAELEDARNFLDSVLEHLPVMLFVKDAEHLRFVRWNKTEEEALGIDRSVAIGKSDYDFFPEEQARFFEAKDRAVLTGGKMVDIPEEAIQTAHRGLRFLHTIKVPVLGTDGKPKYLVGISEDITDRKRAQEELARAREQEAEIGFRIQQTLLLEQPPQDLPGVRAAALTIPSQRIDGDFYDFFNHRDRCLDVIVGDVMGKGIPAALLGAATKSHFLQALSRLISLSEPGTLPEPKDIVTLAHSEVARQLIELESFVTVCYARLDLVNRRLDLVDCGHTTTIHFQAGTGTCKFLADQFESSLVSGHRHFAEAIRPNFLHRPCQFIDRCPQEIRERARVKIRVNPSRRSETRVEISAPGAQD